MLKMLRCRRGSTAFATVVALVPVIGAVALGGEASSWYVTKQRAQNAADTAAYSGGLWLACSLAPSTCTADTKSMDYRGKQYAAQNAFCNAGDTAYPGSHCGNLGSDASQTVVIAAVGGDSVKATVSQTQPAYIAKVLGFSAVTINATATAQVKKLATPCVLALTGAISFNDSAVNVQAPGCGLASNSTTTGFDFKAHPTVNVGSLSTSGTCSGDTTTCNKVLTYAPPVPNPLAALVTAMTTPSNLTLTSCGKNAPLTPYTAATPCANDGSTVGTITTSGVYFFSDLNLNGNKQLITGTGVSATIIMLPGASLRMSGGSILSITAQATVNPSQLPSRLQSLASKLSDVAFYDTESGTPKIAGNPTIAFGGVLYLPNMDLSFNGHPTITPLNTISGCAELFAASIDFVGSPSFSNSGCSADVVPVSQYVRLVQQ
jgi:hypothetical protein